MSTDVVICHAGEPLAWLDELPSSINVIVYDTGLRNSKHGAEAMVERKLGLSLRDLAHEWPQRGFHHFGSHHAQAPLHPPAARAASQISQAVQSLTMVKEIASLLLEQGHRIGPQRVCQTIPASNDHHLRESAQWLRHVITRFHALASVTVFAHGWPFDHVPDMVERIRSAERAVPSWTLLPPAEEPRHIAESGLLSQVERLLQFAGSPGDATQTVWVGGTQFAAAREVLQGPGLAFWEELLALSQSLGPRAAEALERTYHAILTHAARSSTPNSEP